MALTGEPPAKIILTWFANSDHAQTFDVSPPAREVLGLAAAAMRKPTVALYTLCCKRLQVATGAKEAGLYGVALHSTVRVMCGNFPNRVAQWERTEFVSLWKDESSSQHLSRIHCCSGEDTFSRALSLLYPYRRFWFRCCRSPYLLTLLRSLARAVRHNASRFDNTLTS